MKIKVELENASIRRIKEKYILVDIKNNKVFVINEVTNHVIQEILTTNHIDVFKYSRLNNLNINDAKSDINNLIEFLSRNNLVKGDIVFS